MNSFETLETILRGCRPRRPSDKVRISLFGPGAAARDTGFREDSKAHALALRPGSFSFWFAPVAAVAVAVLSLGSILLPSGAPVVQELAFAAVGSGWQSQIGPIEHNLPPTPSFRSTTAAALAPSFGSLLLRQTNALVR